MLHWWQRKTMAEQQEQGRRNWGGGAGGAAAPLAFCWDGQGGQKCPLSIKNIILQLVFKVPLLIIKPVNWHCRLKKFGSY